MSSLMDHVMSHDPLVSHMTLSLDHMMSHDPLINHMTLSLDHMMSHDYSAAALPTLTLWVGTANGSVAGYKVNVIQSVSTEKSQKNRKVELVPTGMYTHKTDLSQ